MTSARNKFLSLLFAAAVLSACKKDSDRPQWDIDVLVPLVRSTLDISNLINDTLLQSDTNHVLHLVYEKNLYDLNLDSLVSIPDTVIKTTVDYHVSVPVPPNFPVYSDTSQFALAVNGPQIRLAILRNGTLTLKAVNYLQTKLKYVFKIPGATLGIDTFIKTGFVSAASANDSLTYETNYDLAGYEINMTGTSGTSYNTISYFLEVRTDPAGDTVYTSAITPIVNLYETFADIFPEYVKGYLGQDTISEGPSTTQVDIFKKIQSGILNLADAKLTCTIENGIGADGRLIISNITGVNNRTGGNVSLSSTQLINRSINIDRALETGQPISPPQTTQKIISVNSTNSNIVDFIENLPDALSYSVQLYTNPIPPGNISGSNDFVYADYLITTKMRFEMPLSFSAGNLTFVDTVDFISKPEETFADFRSGKLKLIAENGFPFQVALTLTLLDENIAALSTLSSTGIIASGVVGANGRVNQKVESVVDIPVSETQMAALKKTKKIITRASFTTAQYPVIRNIYDDYSIGITLVADFTYMIH
ncbi:MAG TPA: hypothetical protein VI757_08980 [Bacteroidia bacterium]|nr:hypothetical protein [Bacteroidia bacterium]